MDIKDFETIEKELPPGQFSTFDMECIYPELIKLLANEIYLEIGVDRGKSLAFARHVTNKDVRVVGIDMKDEINPIQDTRFIHGDSREMSRIWDMWKVSLLFIDGDHSYQGVKTDIESWYPHMKKNGVMFFHDCDESGPGVLQAVAEFYNTAVNNCKKFYLFKKTDKNTSMAAIWL